MQLNKELLTQQTTSPNPQPDGHERITLQNEIPVLTLNGRFDAHVAPRIKAALEEIGTREHPKVIINLAGVHFIDSAALAVLVSSMKKYRQQGGDLVLCTLAQPVRIIFELTRLDKAFAIYTDETSAVAARTGS